MKIFHTILLILILGLVSGCSPGSVSSTAPASTPQPTAVLQPEPTSTEIKPIESQPTRTPVLDTPVIAYNEIKEGRLTTPSAVGEWVFNATAGERINIVLNSQFDTYLELLAPDGEFITSSDDSGNNLDAALLDLQLKQSGPHKIRIHGFDGATGEYALALTGGHPTLGGGLLTDGASRTVMISERGFKWRYHGRQGTYLTVSINTQDLVDSYLSLYGPDGKLLTSDDDSGGNLDPELFEFQLPVDGTYTIQVQTIAETGLVTLNINSSTRTSGGGSLTIGTTQTATLKQGHTHEWSFSGTAGQVINLNLNSTDFDTFLEMRNSQGVILAENDDTDDSSDAGLELFTLPTNDTFTIIARGLSESDGGDYEISLNEVKVVPGGGPLQPDKLTQALLEPGETNTWSFEADASSFITVNVQSDLLDTYLELYGPDDTLLIEDDDSGGELNAALIDFLLAEDGEYELVVRSARQDRTEGGVYEISLTLTENPVSTGQLLSGEPWTGNLARGDQHTWTFEAKTDTFATVRMESDTLDTYLSLYDSTGALLTLNDDFSDSQAVIANFVIPKDGEYRIIARTYSPEEAGDYTISLEITDEALPLGP
jgi:hypothetical protein